MVENHQDCLGKDSRLFQSYADIDAGMWDNVQGDIGFIGPIGCTFLGFWEVVCTSRSVQWYSGCHYIVGLRFESHLITYILYVGIWNNVQGYIGFIVCYRLGCYFLAEFWGVVCIYRLV